MPSSRSPSPRRANPIGSGEFTIEVPGSSAYTDVSTSISHVQWSTGTSTKSSSDPSQSFSRFNPRPQSRLGRAWRHVFGTRDHREKRGGRARWSTSFQELRRNCLAFCSTIVQEYKRGELLPFLARVVWKLWVPLAILAVGMLAIMTLSRRK
jgi:hypothetical protein